MARTSRQREARIPVAGGIEDNSDYLAGSRARRKMPGPSHR